MHYLINCFIIFFFSYHPRQMDYSMCNRLPNVQQNLTFQDQYRKVLVEHKLGDKQYKNGLKQNHDLKTKILDFIES